jgi:hypothetical protein
VKIAAYRLQQNRKDRTIHVIEDHHQEDHDHHQRCPRSRSAILGLIVEADWRFV